MKKIAGIAFAAAAVVGIAGAIMGVGSSSDSVQASEVSGAGSFDESREIAQAPAPTDAAAPADAGQTASTVTPFDDSGTTDSEQAPEVTDVSGHLIKADGSSVAGGVIYFVFQGRLNEIPHTNPLEKVKAMAEEAVSVDAGGSFTLNMKPGNFAMIYDPNATEVPADPGPESMSVMKRLTKEQVQGRIAAIKENAVKGLPIQNGKLGDAFVIENRFIRPPISNFGDLQLQNNAVVTITAVDDKGELITFPATLRLRGKNGDIMEPHTPSISKRAQYSFHDLMPQSYQVFALGSLPRPGAGDEITTPTISNDQFVFTDESLTHEVVVEQPAE